MAVAESLVAQSGDASDNWVPVTLSGGHIPANKDGNCPAGTHALLLNVGGRAADSTEDYSYFNVLGTDDRSVFALFDSESGVTAKTSESALETYEHISLTVTDASTKGFPLAALLHELCCVCLGWHSLAW